MESLPFYLSFLHPRCHPSRIIFCPEKNVWWGLFLTLTTRLFAGRQMLLRGKGDSE